MASLRHGDHDCEAHHCEGQSLYKFIDHAGVRCLNAAEGSDARAVLRPWERRRERTPLLESNEDDCELLLYIPFTSDVKVRARSSGSDARPLTPLARSCRAWLYPEAAAAARPRPCARS